MNNEEDNQVYVLNKNEQLLAVFNKDDEDQTLINPRIEKSKTQKLFLHLQLIQKILNGKK